MKKETKTKSINTYTFKVIRTDKDTRLFEGDKLILFGCCDYLKQEIVVHSELSYQKTYRVLIHELTHAYLHAFLPSFQIKDKFDEEDICDIVSAYGPEIVAEANRLIDNLWG